MKHTAASSLVWLVLTLCPGLGKGLAAQTGQDPQLPTLKALAEKLRTQEKAAKSVEFEFSVRDQFPNGVRFETRGILRVLHKTHFHTAVRVSFDDDVRREMQTVVTPDGVWTRIKDPIEEVYLFMKPELREEMQHKSRKLGGNMSMPGPVAVNQDGLLGGAMLESLSRQFDLAVTGRRDVDKVRCLVLAGPRRKLKSDPSGKDTAKGPRPIPARAEVLLRESDAAPVRMTQFGPDGEAMLSFHVHKLVVDPKLDPATFKIDKPAGATFIDIEKHPPSWAQILRVRDAYAELEEKEKKEKKQGDKGEKKGKAQGTSRPADSRKSPGK